MASNPIPMETQQDTAGNIIKLAAEDYKKKYESYKKVFDEMKDNDSVIFLDELINVVMLFKDHQLKPDHEKALINEYLPSFLKIFMSRKYRDLAYPLYKKINTLFLCAIANRIKYLKEKYPGDLLLLKRFFSPKHLFYDVSYLDLTIEKFNPEADLKGEIDKIMPGLSAAITGESIIDEKATNKNNYSKVLSLNIRIFHAFYGFDLLVEYLSTTTGKDFASNLKLLGFLEKVVEFLKPSFWGQYASSISTATMNLIRSLTEDDVKFMKEKKLKKLAKTAATLMKGTTGIKPENDPEIQLAKMLLGFYLNGNLRGIGINMIESKIDSLKYRNPTGKPEDAISIEFAEYLSHWYLNLMTTQLQGEFIRKSTKIISFLYCWGKLLMKDIITILELALSKPESIKSPLFSLLDSIILHFSNQHALEFLARVEKIQFCDYKDSIVSLISSLGKNEYYRNRKLKPKEKKDKKVSFSTDDSAKKRKHREIEEIKHDTKLGLKGGGRIEPRGIQRSHDDFDK